MSYLEDPVTSEDEQTSRWLLAGFVLLQLAPTLNPDDWDGISFDAFRRQMQTTYGGLLQDWIRTYHLTWLESRGIPAGVSATPSGINSAIAEAVRGTRDLHRSMQRSFSTGTFGEWGGSTHQGLILRDLARISADHLNERIATRLEDQGLFTGRQRWRTTNENSRHAELNMQIAPGLWRYKGNNVKPRHNPQNPHEWSGCSCYIEYEWRAGGDQGWI